MKKTKYFWGFARVLVALINLVGLPYLFDGRTNFNLLAGGICGTITCLALILWLKGHSAEKERLDALNVPFWPVSRHPQAYWLTMGGSLSLASAVGALAHMNNPKEFQFFAGFLLLGVGIVFAVLLARRLRGEKG
jgi:hypothetical protein